MNNPFLNLHGTRIAFLGGLTFLFVTGCGSQSTEFDPKPNLLTPEGVVENLTVSYQERNIERYMSNYADSSIFLDGQIQLWGVGVEKSLHERMFEAARELDLTMRPIANETHGEGSVQTTYRYQVNLQPTSGAAMRASGEVALAFIRGEGNGWKILSFRERERVLKKTSDVIHIRQDSVDFFPLRVGNSWTYEEQFAPNIPDVEAVVSDSLMLRGNLYYSLQNSGFPFLQICSE